MAAALLPYQQSVVQEKDDLEIKLQALNNFRKSEQFPKLSVTAQTLLDRQATLMLAYSIVLERRIDYFYRSEG